MVRIPRVGSLALSAVLCLALGFAACGDDDEDTSSSKAGSDAATSESPAVAAAKKDYAAAVKEQPAIEIPALAEKPASDRTVTIVTCPLPVCKAETDPAKEAAEQLGWKVNYVSHSLTPASFQSTMDRVVQNPGDLVTYVPAVPNSFITKQLEALKAKKVPVAVIAPAGDSPSPDGLNQAAVVGKPHFAESGRLMGVSVVNDAGEGAKTVFVTDPAIKSIWGPIQEAYTKTVTDAGGSVDLLNVSTQNIGKSIPTQVVSYVQAHPDVKYLTFALADITVGVPQALASAGVADKVKIVSRAPQAANLANINAGTEFASVGEENTAGGWRTIDQLARLDAGVEMDDELRNPVGWHQIFTKDNVTETSGPPPTPGSPDVFLKAWQLG